MPLVTSCLREDFLLTLSTADGPTTRFALVPDGRVTRGSEVDVGSVPLSAFIEITQPLVTPITKKLVGDDPELEAFWAAERGKFRYDYVTFRCTLIPASGAPFEKAWIEVSLAPNAAVQGPIAYSMAPEAVIDVTTTSDSAEIAGDLKFVKSKIGSKTEVEAKSYFLRAWRERTAAPYWELQKTDSTDLKGTFKFHLVTRTPASLDGTGRLTARAVIKKRTLWIFEEEKPAGEPARLEFSLPSGS